MKPYFEDKGITIFSADCIEAMRSIPDGSIDACITDPPYGTTACSWDAVIPFAPMWVELKRIVKPKSAIVLFASQPFTSALVMSNPEMFKYEWVWVKNTCVGVGAAKYQPMRYSESVLVFYRQHGTYNPQPNRRTSQSGIERARYAMKSNGEVSNHARMPNVVGHYNPFYKLPSNVLAIDSTPNHAGRLHPTQKPVHLLRYLVRTYTNEGDTVLDFTCGSGTTGVACAIERRRFIGVEQDADYCAISQARITRASGIACDIPKRARDYAPTPLFENVA